MRRIVRICIFSIAILMLIALAGFEICRSRSFQFFGHIVSKVATDKKVVALTFDDGPTERLDTVLQILSRYHVHATFFFTGTEMADHLELTRKAINEGHSIGNHSYTHQRMIFKSNDFIRREVEQTDSIIRTCGYKGKIYFRPPYCKKLFYLPYYLKETNRTTATWNLEPDTDSNDEHTMLEYIKYNIKPGSIILLHVMYKERRATINALPQIVDWLQKEGYSILPLDELIEKRTEQ